VALISVPVSNDGEGAPGPSLLGTGDDVQRLRKGRDTARTNKAHQREEVEMREGAENLHRFCH
jgi:hypothetical protein